MKVPEHIIKERKLFILENYKKMSILAIQQKLHIGQTFIYEYLQEITQSTWANGTRDAQQELILKIFAKRGIEFKSYKELYNYTSQFKQPKSKKRKYTKRKIKGTL